MQLRAAHGQIDCQIYRRTMEQRHGGGIHWVPTHIEIKGNEAANIAAKQATGWKQRKHRNGKVTEQDTDWRARPATLAWHLKSGYKTVLKRI